ncbi:two component sensor kinase [Clostridia bacterium]|nr:two component sensor kinase [Clostridia bacterium]
MSKFHKGRSILTILFHIIAVIFIVQFFTVLCVASGTVFLIRHDVISRPLPLLGISVIAIVSLCVGTMLSVLLIRWLTKPYGKLINAIREIAAGHFNTRLELSGIREAEVLSDSFNKMAAELDSIETLRSDFIRNVAHEFRTPVSSIKGFAKLLKKNNLSNENRAEYIDIIIRESERLAQLSSNVLMLSKLENQEMLTERQTFLVDEQLRRTILMLEPEWKRKHIDIDAELDDREYFGNEEMLMQVWVNLIDNAIKFTPNGGRITVSIRNGNPLTICVADNGCGMDEETIRHIFEKFYQGDKSHAAKGNGLGLPLVKRILEMVDGAITVTSEEGKGTEVFVTLD